MTLIEEVLGFSREYVNHYSYRTKERKAKIRQALFSITGESLNFGCSTCYVEAIFKIKKYTQMASTKYELKRGVVLTAFGDSSKTCTNDTITDELGDWYMKHYPQKAIYFARLPVAAGQAVLPSAPIIPPDIVILPPKHEPSVADVAGAMIAGASGQEEVKVKAKSPHKPKGKK